MSLISDNLSFVTVPKIKAVSGSLWTFLFLKQLNKIYNRELRNLYDIEYLQIYY